MKKRITYIVLILILLVQIAEIQIFSQITVNQIIQKHFEVSGFDSIPYYLKTFQLEGEMVQDQKNFPLKIRGIWPDKLRMDLTYNNQNYIKISNGKVSWDYNPKIDSVSSQINEKPEALNFMDRLTGGLYNYKSGAIQASLMGMVSIDEVELYKVEVLIDKYVRIYYIDCLSFLIIRIDDDIKENKITYYSDYRKVGKYYFPFSISGFEAGRPAIAMQFKSIQINSELKEDLFYKPELDK
jgi:outer membrane lipoprotein-sorting protein